MNILFKDDKEKEMYQNPDTLRKKFGLQIAKMITKRIQELQAFSSIGELLSSGIGKGHFLKGDYKHCLALSLTGNYRLIVQPFFEDDTDFSVLKTHNLNIVIIIKVEDYHGK